MRINIYSQELPDGSEGPSVELVSKPAADTAGELRDFFAVRLYLRSGRWLHNTSADDDRSAVTVWLPDSPARRLMLARDLERMADLVRETTR